MRMRKKKAIRKSTITLYKVDFKNWFLHCEIFNKARTNSRKGKDRMKHQSKNIWIKGKGNEWVYIDENLLENQKERFYERFVWKWEKKILKWMENKYC